MKKITKINKILLAVLFVIIVGGFVNVPKSHAAYLNITGFETGSLIEGSTGNIGGAVSTSVKRTGSYSYFANGAQSVFSMGKPASNGSNTALGVNSAYFTGYFYISSSPTGTVDIFSWQAASNYTKLEMDTNRQLRLYYRNESLAWVQVGVASSALSTGTWYRIEVSITNSNTTTAGLEFKVDGISIASGTTTNLYNPGALQYANFGLGIIVNGPSGVYYWDDVAISDSAYPGAGQVNILKPNAAGTYSDWTSGTSSHYTAINEVPPNGDTSYIASAGYTQLDSSFNLDDATSAGVGGTIGATKWLAICRQTTGTSFSPGWGIGRIVGGTSYPTMGPGYYAMALLPTSYTTYAIIDSWSPKTGLAYTTTELDSAQIGAENNIGGQDARCTGMYAMVWNTGVPPELPPTTTTSAASSITTSQAILNSTINPNGASTNVSYLWGTQSGVACNLQPNTLAGPTALTGTANLSGATTQATLPSLSSNEPYYFCVMATNTYGTTYGSVLTFNTETSNPSSYTYMDAGSALGSGATIPAINIIISFLLVIR